MLNLYNVKSVHLFYMTEFHDVIYTRLSKSQHHLLFLPLPVACIATPLNLFSNMALKAFSFISMPDASLLCSICLDLASQLKQCEDCGKLFCSECIEKKGKKPCQNCRTDNPRYFKDVRSKF